MRDIKFRAWVSENDHPIFSDVKNEFIHGWQDTIYIENVSFKPDLKFVTVEQYTGLKDKNGIEIYEGDILSGKYVLTDSNGYDTELEFENYEVIWNDEYQAFTVPCTIDKYVKHPIENYLNFLYQVSECVITGNIHNN